MDDRERRSRELVPIILAGGAPARPASEELVSLWKNDTWSMIYRWHYRQISEEEQEEIFQEVWIGIFTSLDRYAEDRAFGAWLFGILRNRCLERRRRLRRHRQIAEAAEADPNPERTGPSPEQSALADEKLSAVEACVGALGERMRWVVLLLLVDELSHKEVAEIVGVSPGNSRTIWSRARRLVAACLARKGVSLD